MCRTGRRLLLASVVVLAGLTILGEGRAEAQTAKITAIVLEVTHRVGAEGAWRTSTVGSTLPAGSRVRTARRSKCQITFPDGSIIRMGERSDLVIQQATNVQLSSGRLYAKIVAGTMATVQGSTGVAAVKGTEFEYTGIAEEDKELPANLRHEILRVFGGEVLFSNDSGSQTLTAGTESYIVGSNGPAAPVPTPPAQFPGGQADQWWGDVRPGVTISATPGGPVGAQMNRERVAVRATEATIMPPPDEGSLDVVVTSLAAGDAQPAQPPPTSAATWRAPACGEFPGLDRNNLLASTPLPLGAFPFDAITDAAAGQSSGGADMLGKRFFGPKLGVDLFGFWAEGGSLVGILPATSAVWGDAYLQVSGLAWSDLHGLTTELADTYAMMRPGKAEIILGRQRFLDGPTNNTPVGSLFTFDVADALRVNYQAADELRLTAAYLQDFSPLLDPDADGTFLRAEYSALGGTLGGSWLHQSGADQEAWMCDAALPLVPHLLDAYGQYGEDPMGRKLGTVGAYFPDLYQTHETDLFIEYAWRDNLPGVTSLRAYKPAGNFDMVLLLQREAGGAAGIGIGAVIHSGD